MVEPEQHRLFLYRARERSTGRMRSGETSGPDAYTVRSGLRTIGLDVEWLQPRRAALRLPTAWADRLNDHRRSRRVVQRADLCDALASLLGAGLTLERALGELSSSEARPTVERRLLGSLRDAVRQGLPMDAAATAHPDWFDPVDLAMLAIGHRSGDLPRVLVEMSRTHQRGADTGHKLIMALSYPALLLAAAVAVVAFIGNATLPQLLAMLADAHVPQPAVTVAVARIGQALVQWWWLAIIAIPALLMSWRAIRARLPKNRGLIPLLGRLPVARARRRLRSAAIANVLGQMLRNGIPLDAALDTAALATADGSFRDFLLSCAHGVRRGESFSQQIRQADVLDPEFGQLVQVGEQAGELPDMCQRLAERFERAAQRTIDRLAAIAEPAAILSMAMIIGVVVMAAILPLIALGDII